ncbi:MAG: ABC transporter ATP-binding protein [Sphaerochaetaceae bacterium]|jgi:peptide/nickel transport system ATP-binding protein|nr:ABC transporter ATP-binding protein [Sphaerochaetaceae bacterium]
MAEEHDILNIEDLKVRFETEDGTVYAVNGVNLRLGYHKTLGLVGETGAGKTTTALAMLRLVPDPPGVVECKRLEIDGQDVRGMSITKLEQVRGKDISMIFQDPMTALNPVFTVGQQIAESIEIHEHLGKAEALEKAGDMLEMVGIPRARANEYPHQFSGGMKQRVVIAIALACNPKLLIADEPTTALDVTIQAQVLELMNELKEKYDTSMIMITHDLGIVAEVCDEVAVMYAGRIVEQGSLEEVFGKTMHPYTEGLFNSLPNIKNRTAKLKPIHGLMPDPTKLPEGCPFAPRCNYATEDCRKAVPELHRASGTHMVACSAYERDKNFMIDRRKR